MSQFSILILDSQTVPQPRADLKQDAYGLQFSTLLPGGCNACTFRVRAPIRFVPPYLGYGYEVRLLDGQGVFWSGRMEDILPHRGANDGEYWEVTALGFAVNLDDQIYTSQDVNGTVTSAIASGAVSSLAPQIDVRTVTASGYTLSAASAVNLKMLTARAVVNWAAQYGDTSFNPQIWYVYPTDKADVEFVLKPRPSTADLLTRLDDMDLFEGGISGQRLANRVIVEYNAGASTVTVNDTTLQGAGPAGWGFVKSYYLFHPEITQSADATQLANAVLEALTTIRLAARSIRMLPGVRFLDAAGAAVNPWRVRSGQLLRITDIVSADVGVGNLTWNNSLLLVGTEYDEDSQGLTLTPENHDLTLQQVVAQAVALFRGRHTTARSAS